MIMICAGSGLAPFRGFVQDRALAATELGVAPAPALLFYGCDHPDVDHIYRDELDGWAEQGVVSVRTAYSSAPAGDVRYVQDRLWADRAEVVRLVRAGAVVFVCGDGRHMAPAVHDTCVRIHQEATGARRAESEAWMTTMEQQHGRYVTDVFA